MDSNHVTLRSQSPVENKKLIEAGSGTTSRLYGTLRTEIEHRAGVPMDDVSVHYNSSDPEQMDALAFAAGTNIYLGPGQEKYLSHEAWHIAQQKLGRVRATGEVNGRPVNDDAGLEHEANSWRSTAAPREPQNLVPVDEQSSTVDVIQRVRLSNASGTYSVDINNKTIAHVLNKRFLNLLGSEGPRPWFAPESPASSSWSNPTDRQVSTLADYYQLLKELRQQPSFYYRQTAPEGIAPQIISSPLDATTEIAKFGKPDYVDNRSIGITATEKIDPTYVQVQALYEELAAIQDAGSVALGEDKVGTILLDLLKGVQHPDYTNFFGIDDKLKARTILSLLLESEPLRFGSVFAYAPLLLNALADGQITAQQAFDANGEQTPTKTPSLWPPAYVGSRKDLFDLEKVTARNQIYNTSFPDRGKGAARRNAFIAKMGHLIELYLGNDVDFSDVTKSDVPGSDFTNGNGALNAVVNLIFEELLGTVPAFHEPARDSPTASTRRGQETHNSLLYELKDKTLDLLGGPLEDDAEKPKLTRSDSVDNLFSYLKEGQTDRKRIKRRPGKEALLKRSRRSGLVLKQKLYRKRAAPEDTESEDEFGRKLDTLVEEQKVRHKRRRSLGLEPPQHRKFESGFLTGVSEGPIKAKKPFAKQFRAGRTEGRERRDELIAQGRADAEEFLNSGKLPNIPSNPAEAEVWLQAYSTRLTEG